MAYWLIFLSLILGAGRVPLFAQNPPPLWGRTVTDLRLQCDCDLKLQNFPGAVTQQAGGALDPAKVSESLQRLYATGRFMELKAEGAAEGSGVVLTFVARAEYFVGVVIADGNTGPVDPRALVTASRLRLGQPLRREDLDAALKRLRDLMVSNGYYQSQISDAIERDPKTLEANVRFTLRAGKAARVSAVEFGDNAAFPPERLRKISGWHPHMFLTALRVEHGLYRLRQFYMKHGRLQAGVSLQQRIYDPKTNTERVLVKANAGPLIRVRVQGASISASKLENLLPLYHDGITDDQALLLSKSALKDYYQQKGYFLVSIQVSRVLHENPQPYTEILFHVTLGVHGEFAGYGVKGNTAIPTSELTAAIAPPASGFLPPPPTFNETLMKQKEAILLALYQSRGFLDARITPSVEDNFEGIQGKRRVVLVIDEGPRTTVHTLTLAGINAATTAQILPLLASKPGEPYSPDRTHADRDRILDFMADQGYMHASVNWRAAPADVPYQMNLEFRVAPGEQERIQHIVVLGNEHTRLALVNRELKVHTGEPLNQDAIRDSQRQLYDLGIFNQVQITPQDLPAAAAQKTLLVGLEESRRWILGYGGGFEVQRLGSNTPQGTFKASPRGSLDVTRLNVGGRGQTFSMAGRLSNIETGGNASYLIPRLFNRNDLSLRISGLVDRSRDVLTFLADRKEASISVEKRFSASTLLIGQYSFRRVAALDIADKISAEEAPILGQPQPVGILGGSFIQDHRDDPTDATRGAYTLVNAGIAWKDLGSRSDFLRFTGQNSTYYRLNSHLVLARETEFGVVSPYGRAYQIKVPGQNGQPPSVIFTHAIPLPERYFMGGSESLRGFSINQAGPRDPVTGYPIGGNALFFNSVELRTYFAQRRFGVVLFEDAGNVYSSIRRMRLFKVQQDSPEDFDYTSHAVGVGLRYKTPVGPIRFDVGYNLNPPRFNVTTTTNGVPSTEVQRLSHVQFFLSIGQSF